MAFHPWALIIASCVLGHPPPGGDLPPTTPPVTAPPVSPTNPPPPEEDAAPESVPVTFRLRDGVQVRGTATAWDVAGIDGSFGLRAWTELRCNDAWQILRRLHDHKSAADWLFIARVMLLYPLDHEDDRARAERHAVFALRMARRIDPEIEDAITSMREDIAAEKVLREEEARADEAMRLRTLSPEAGPTRHNPWSNAPWPELSADDQETAVVAVKADAREILDRAGLVIKPVETRFFLFYSDMPAKESQRWARELDKMYELLARRFGLDPEVNIFWGKAVIFVFNERDRFRLVESESFRHFVPEWADGIFHPRGPKCFVSFYRQPRDEMFAAVLVHETTHAFMHRYRTPRRLPTWANEGIADYMASVLFRGSTIDRGRRRKGLHWIRNNGDVDSVLDMRYVDGSWPGEREIGYPIGYLLVELMIRDQPRSFGKWVDMIKEGAEWEEALQETFKTDRAGLVRSFVQFYRVND